METPALNVQLGSGVTLCGQEGALVSQEPHTPEKGLLLEKTPEGGWRGLREKQLTSRPGKGAPSGLAWEALAASSSHSSPPHCCKTGAETEGMPRNSLTLQQPRTRPHGETPHRFPINEKWWEEGVLSLYVFTYLLTY